MYTDDVISVCGEDDNIHLIPQLHFRQCFDTVSRHAVLIPCL